MNDLSVLNSTPAIFLVTQLLPICSYYISYLYEWGKTCQRCSKPPYSGATAGIIHTKWMFNLYTFRLEILCSFDKDFRMFSKLQLMGINSNVWKIFSLLQNCIQPDRCVWHTNSELSRSSASFNSVLDVFDICRQIICSFWELQLMEYRFPHMWRMYWCNIDSHFYNIFFHSCNA